MAPFPPSLHQSGAHLRHLCRKFLLCHVCCNINIFLQLSLDSSRLLWQFFCFFPLHFHKFTDCRCPYCIAKCHLSSLHTLNRRLCVSNFICAWHVIQGRIWFMLDNRDLETARIPPSLLTAPSPRALRYTLYVIPLFPAVLLLLLDQDGCLPTQFVVK